VEVLRVVAAALVVAGALGRPGLAGEPAPPKDDLASRAHRYLSPLVESGLFAGTVLLAREGKVVVDRAYGLADVAAKTPIATDTAFKLMSVTKSMTAVAVLALVQEGRLDLESPVKDVLPRWPEGWRDVRVRHLLEHTSARAGADRGLATWRRLAPSLSNRTLDAPAGSRHAYSNFHYVLLASVLEAKAGKPYVDAMRALVLDPAGMKATTFDDGSRRPRLAVGYFRGKEGAPAASEQDMSVIRGAGDAISTTGDLWRLDRALSGDAILSAATRRTMTTPPAGAWYALGWQVLPVHDRPCVRHSGGANGYVADFLRFSADDACVVVLSNLAYAPIVRIGEDLAGLLFDRAVETPRRVAADDLAPYLGAYRGGVSGSTFLVRASGPAAMLFEVSGATARIGGALLVPVGEHRFQRQQWPTDLAFDPPEKSRSRGVLVTGRGASPARFERVESAADAWIAAVGEYREREPGRGALRIVASKGRLFLRAAPYPADLELVPASDTDAVVLFSEEFGTILTLERDRGGAPRGLRWERNDGQVVRAARAP
jgi:D-alanyl-D-alanine carboxypeptidase